MDHNKVLNLNRIKELLELREAGLISKRFNPAIQELSREDLNARAFLEMAAELPNDIPVEKGLFLHFRNVFQWLRDYPEKVAILLTSQLVTPPRPTRHDQYAASFQSLVNMVYALYNLQGYSLDGNYYWFSKDKEKLRYFEDLAKRQNPKDFLVGRE
ncbi:hypothetical protein [Candidatus Formimonas warabiya]|uniref:Uncharacterized protein n=1 Tax=Formimonas warabiya TaxID=1761012 RepID=A0A3G1KTK2_FORW1|nr:hypothetical protein [Candidatus Formimonas warabiya]ATW25760.1 hypothetical protein DCMF_14200 [Candidatus Formimonas warabiya]